MHSSTVLFDLDNTLFNVEQYYSGAFEKVSMFLSIKHELSKPTIYDALMKIWKENTSMYPHIFDDLLNLLGIEENVKTIVKVFNEFDGPLVPYPGLIPTLKALKNKNYKLGIITDGNVERQKRKIDLLGIRDYFDLIINVKELNEHKPSEIPFQVALKKLKQNPKNIFFIGDNPILDFKGAKKLGLNTIRIKKGEFSRFPNNELIDTEINVISDLLNIL